MSPKAARCADLLVPHIPVKQSLLDLCRASLKGKEIFGERIGRDAEEQGAERVEQDQELDGEAV